MTVHFALSLCAQTRSTEQSEAETGEVVRLDAFTVTASDSDIYRAEKATAGTLIAMPINQLPLSLQVVTAQLLNDISALRVEDAIRYTSGVALTAGNEGSLGATSTENFVIRGFQTGSILRNGLRAQGITDPSNLERVEILKGPSSIFFGAADPGGIVNYVTKQPLPKTFGSVQASYGRFEQMNIQFDYNAPLYKDKLLLRVDGSWTDNQMWRRFCRDKQLFGSAVLVYYPTKTTQISYSTEVRRETGLLPRTGDVWLTTDNPAPFTQRFLPKNIDAVGQQIGGWFPSDTYWELATGNVLRVTQKIGDATVIQVNVASSDSNREQRTTYAAFRTTVASAPFYRYTDRPGLCVEGASDRTINVNVLHQFEIAGVTNKLLAGWDRKEQALKDIEISYTAGSAYSTTRNMFDSLSFADRYSVKRYPTLSEIGTPDVIYVINGPWQKPIPDQGFYITDTASMLHDKLTVVAGGRYSYLGIQKIHATTPQFGVNYALTKNLTVYALYSKSFRANPRSSTLDPNSPYFPPEYGIGYEGGAKINLFDGMFTGTMAYFDVKKTNIYTLNSGEVVFGRNGASLAGGQESKGVEVDFVITPTKQLSAVVAYAYTDARVTKDIITAQTPDLNGDGIADDVNNQHLRNVSPHAGSIWVKYDFTRGRLKGLSLGSGYQYRSGPILQDAAWARLKLAQDGYYRLDVMASYSTRVFGLLTRFQLNWNNVTDQRYQDKSLRLNDPYMWKCTVAVSF